MFQLIGTHQGFEHVMLQLIDMPQGFKKNRVKYKNWMISLDTIQLEDMTPKLVWVGKHTVPIYEHATFYTLEKVQHQIKKVCSVKKYSGFV